MLTDMSVELKPFVPGEEVREPSEEEITEELGSGSKLAPLVDKLRDMEGFVGNLTGGAPFARPPARSPMRRGVRCTPP